VLAFGFLVAVLLGVVRRAEGLGDVGDVEKISMDVEYEGIIEM